jgi:hypothetical protein
MIHFDGMLHDRTSNHTEVGSQNDVLSFNLFMIRYDGTVISQVVMFRDRRGSEGLRGRAELGLKA